MQIEMPKMRSASSHISTTQITFQSDFFNQLFKRPNCNVNIKVPRSHTLIKAKFYAKMPNKSLEYQQFDSNAEWHFCGTLLCECATSWLLLLSELRTRTQLSRLSLAVSVRVISFFES